MSQVKRHLEEHEARDAEMERIGIEAEALNLMGTRTRQVQRKTETPAAPARLFRRGQKGRSKGLQMNGEAIL